MAKPEKSIFPGSREGVKTFPVSSPCTGVYQHTNDLSTRQQCTSIALHGLCLAAAQGRLIGDPSFHRRSSVQRRSPIPVRGRLLELR
eukprot:scaffold15690_cov66-Phaeocystis_antarctica.AAC.2